MPQTKDTPGLKYTLATTIALQSASRPGAWQCPVIWHTYEEPGGPPARLWYLNQITEGGG